MKRLTTQKELVTALENLARQDKDMARAYQQYGAPQMRKSQGGFAGLAYILIGQQVSTKAALTIRDRFYAALDNEITAENFLNLRQSKIGKIGLSRQKQSYITGVAEAIVAGTLNFNKLARADDETVRDTLSALKGIGPWSVDIFLMFSMRRADIMPIGDLGLQEGCRRVKRLRARPTPEKLDKIAQKWAPYRTAASLLLWHYYDKSRQEDKLG